MSITKLFFSFTCPISFFLLISTAVKAGKKKRKKSLFHLLGVFLLWDLVISNSVPFTGIRCQHTKILSLLFMPHCCCVIHLLLKIYFVPFHLLLLSIFLWWKLACELQNILNSSCNPLFQWLIWIFFQVSAFCTFLWKLKNLFSLHFVSNFFPKFDTFIITKKQQWVYRGFMWSHAIIHQSINFIVPFRVKRVTQHLKFQIHMLLMGKTCISRDNLARFYRWKQISTGEVHMFFSRAILICFYVGVANMQ